MIKGEGLLLHIGLNLILSPGAVIDRRTGLGFQQCLLDNGIEIAQVIYGDGELVAVCLEPTRLEVKVSAPAPNVGQLLVLGPDKPGAVTTFAEQADAIVRAYGAAWPVDARQYLASDATIRILYETNAEHAFKQLWEERLGQSRQGLSTLGGPVLGGGLRFVLPKQEPNGEQYLIDVKIESYLQDTAKIFVETQFKRAPQSPSFIFSVKEHLAELEAYVDHEILSFLNWQEETHT